MWQRHAKASFLGNEHQGQCSRVRVLLGACWLLASGGCSDVLGIQVYEAQLLSADEAADWDAICAGRGLDEAFCDGNTRTVCRARPSIEREACVSAQHCSLATGSGCAACLPNSHECLGDVLRQCTADLSGFDDVATCTGVPCNAGAGACTPLACLESGRRRCNGDVLEACNADRSGFDVVDSCGVGLCDPVALECDVCLGGELGCASDTTATECSADGQEQVSTPCPDEAPRCTGAGQCVRCTESAQCVPASECHTARCDTGRCLDVPAAERATCTTSGGSGVCDVGGQCLECLDAGDCDELQVCRSGACRDAVHNYGTDAPLDGMASLSAAFLYLFRAPPAERAAAILRMGVIGAQAGANVTVILYADDGTGSRPDGAPIAYNPTDIALFDGVRFQSAFGSAPSLAAGATYWIGVSASAAALLRSEPSPGAVGAQFQYAHGSAFPVFDDDTSADLFSNNGVLVNAFVEVQDLN